MGEILEYRLAPASVSSPTIRKTSAAGGHSRITGHAAVFFDGTPGTEYQLDRGVVERIEPTAFDRALRERQDVHALFNHNRDLVIGRAAAGTLRLWVDARGLGYSVDVANTTLGRDLIETVRRGDISGASFSFIVTDSRWTDGPGGLLVRELHDLDLWDVSVSTRGAYSAADAAVESDERKRLDPMPNESISACHRRLMAKVRELDAEDFDDYGHRDRLPAYTGRAHPGSINWNQMAKAPLSAQHMLLKARVRQLQCT